MSGTALRIPGLLDDGDPESGDQLRGQYDPEYLGGLLRLLRAAGLEASGGGTYMTPRGANILGYGGRVGMSVPLGSEGYRADVSAEGTGVDARGQGWRMRENRLEGLGLGVMTPGGDRFSMDYHDRRQPQQDTMPGADPDDLLNLMRGGSRGWRLGWRREF